MAPILPKSYSVGTTGHEFLLSRPQDNQADPISATLSDGGAVVLYSRRAADSSGIATEFAQVVDGRGNPVGAPIQVQPVGEGYTKGVVALADGGFAVVWNRFEASGDMAPDTVFRAFAKDGTPVSPEVVHLDELSTVLALKDGSLMRVWLAEDMGTEPRVTGVMAQKIAADGTLIGAPVEVAAPVEGYEHAWTAASLDDGSVAVTWTLTPGIDSTDPRVTYARVIGADGQPKGAQVELFSAPSDGMGGYEQSVTNVALHSDASGGYSVTWNTIPPSSAANQGYGLSVQRYTADGDKAGGEVMIFPPGALDSPTAPRVFDLSDGTHLVTFHTETSGNPDAPQWQLAVQVLGADWRYASPPTWVGASTDLGNYTVTETKPGQVLVTWNSFDPSAPEYAFGLDVSGRVLVIGEGDVPSTPGPLTVSVLDGATVVERAGGTWAALEVVLSRDADAPVTVSYATRDGAAMAGQDYVARTGELVFGLGETRKTVWVQVLDDARHEATEHFGLQITAASGDGVAVADGVGIVRIEDDNDPRPYVASLGPDIAVQEGTSHVSPRGEFTVTLDRPAETVLTLRYDLHDGTAVSSGPEADFGSTGAMGGTVVFQAGQSTATIVVPIYADGRVEGDETFSVSLSPLGENVTIGRGSATGTILNDDVRSNALVYGGPGNDTWGLAKSTDFHGGGGFDTVVARDAAGHALGYGQVAVSITNAWNGEGTFTSRDGTTSHFTGVESISFADGRLEIGSAGLGASVNRLYEAVLGRDGEAAGIAFWTDRLEDGAETLVSAANGFANSPEFQARFGALGTGQFVEKLYEQVLGRGSDAGGFAHWSELLDSGRASRGDVVLGFSESAEMKAQHNGDVVFVADQDAMTVARIYQSVLLRPAEGDGMKFWVDRADTMTPDAMVDAFTNSAEFQARIAGMSNADFVQSFYQNALGRAAEQGGLDFWVAHLEGGLSRGDVAKGFIFSDEMVHNQAVQLNSGLHMSGDVW